MRLNLLDKNKIRKLTIFISCFLLIIGTSLITLVSFRLSAGNEIFNLSKIFINKNKKQFFLKDIIFDIYTKFQPQKNNDKTDSYGHMLLSNFINEAKKIKPAGDFLFLILFQNDLELRPTGGYIGSYGILEIKDFKFSKIQVFDTVNLDSNSTFAEAAPLVLQQYLRISRLQMRDSNWDPDFAKSASKALYFYKNEAGDNRNFDGVVGLNTKVLEELVELIKPFVAIKAGGRNFSSENIVLELEKEVEINYLEKNIPRANRKDILDSLANYLIKNLNQLVKESKISEESIYSILYSNFKRKNILLWFNDLELNEKFKSLKLTSSFEVNDNDDSYSFGIVDANMNSLKSNFFVKRSSEYIFDTPKNLLTLKLKYTNTAFQKSWFNRDYLSYTRVYLPRNLELINTTLDHNISITFEDYNQNFQSLGFPIYVPLKNTVELEFVFKATSGGFGLEENNIKIIKQPGLHNENVTIKVIYPKTKHINYVKYNNKGNLYFPQPGTILFDFILVEDENVKFVFD